MSSGDEDSNKDENKELSLHASSSLLEQKSNEGTDIKSHQKNVNLSRYLKSIALCLGFFMSGYDVTIWGLALPTLAENVKKTIADFTAVIFARGAGFLCGSLAIGLTEGLMDTEFAVSLTLCIVAISLVLIPTILHFASIIIFSFMVSFGLGAFETVGNVFCIKLWGEQAQSAIQLVHLFFCIGCVVAPISAAPFLNDVQNVTINNGTEIFRDVIYVGDTNLPYLSVIYIIIASITFAISLYFLFLSLYFETVSVIAEEPIEKKSNKWFRYKLLVLLFLLFFFYIGLYLTMSTFLYTFAISDVPSARYTKDQASDLNTVFLIAITVGQFLSVFAAKKFSPTFNVILNLSAAMICSLALLFLPYYGDVTELFWALLAVYGVFIAGVYGYLFSWANLYIVADERAASVFIVGGSCGEMVLPLLLGLFIDEHPMYFLYTLFICISFLVVLFLLALKVARNYGTKSERNALQIEADETCQETGRL